jgi:hypothetical protein
MVIRGIVGIAIVAIPAVTAVIGRIAMMPTAGSAVHLVDDVGGGDSTGDGLRAWKLDRTGAGGVKSRDDRECRACQDVKGLAHDLISHVCLMEPLTR